MNVCKMIITFENKLAAKFIHKEIKNSKRGFLEKLCKKPRYELLGSEMKFRVPDLPEEIVWEN